MLSMRLLYIVQASKATLLAQLYSEYFIKYHKISANFMRYFTIIAPTESFLLQNYVIILPKPSSLYGGIEYNEFIFRYSFSTHVYPVP